MPPTRFKSARRFQAAWRIVASRKRMRPRNRPPRSQLRPSEASYAMTVQEREELEAILGHRFKDTLELERALIHRSHRQNSNDTDNERLEFLGDRVLGLVASEELCRTFPEWDSGKLSK